MAQDPHYPHQDYDRARMHELLYQALETEKGGALVYQTALRCAINPDLRKEWGEYLEHTRTHQTVLLGVFAQLGLDPSRQTAGGRVQGHLAQAMVAAIVMAEEGGDRLGTELLASECVVAAETKDHLNWALIGYLAGKGSGHEQQVLQRAFEAVEQDQDHHLYHATGWTRELWLDALGLPAVLPPPDEIKDVGRFAASQVERSREQSLKDGH